MGKIGIWFLYSCKRQLKRPFFVALLIALPVCLLWFGSQEESGGEGVRIALFSREDGLAKEIVSALCQETGAFDFYMAEDEESLIADVESRQAECGYVFYEDFKEKLDTENYKRSIGLVTAPSTVAAKLSTEVVFARLMEIYGRDLLEQYAGESQIFARFTPKEAWAGMEPLYDKYLSDGSTFSFTYQVAGEKSEVMEQESLQAVFPVRGMVAVYVFVVGLFSAVMLCEDERRGLFLPVSYPARIGCTVASVAAPIFLSAVSGLAAICMAGGGSLWREALLMAVYVAAAAIFSCLLKKIVRHPMALCGLIPLLTIASLVVCPVFADLSSFVPVIKTVRLFFLPYYYLAAGNIFL